MIAPVVVLALVLLGWHAAVTIFALPPYVLPSPVAVAAEAATHAPELASATAVTGAAAAIGFAVSAVLGVLIGFVFAQSRLLARSFYPYAVFLQTVPIVAIAPLIVIWSGPGFRSVVLVTVLVSVFPIITAATAGLGGVERDLVELFRVHDASAAQTLWKLRLPHAVPQLVAGAQAAGGLAVVGAIAGEIFAGYGAEAPGLGYLIMVTSGQLRTAYLFAAVLSCTLLGLLAFGTLALVGGLVTARWRDVA
ncbi:MAG TPA: ABC transporter permease subunit [Candidatus Binatia bacterium]|jgi:NitT/TauT family transport system permease protein|nr:ABC transporter permease subunit [Candidatus Binatia bacterium]